MNIYGFALESCETSNKRISYISDNALHHRESPGAVRYKLPFTVREHHLTFKGNRAIGIQDIRNAECNIHLADIDDLLCLASTCRLLRSEVLALAWSNADISITSPALLLDLHYIFLHRLSSDTCTCIRTLQIKIEEYAWSSRDMKQIVGLVHTRQPQLEELVLNLPIRFSSHPNKTTIRPRHDALMALQSLPRDVTVIFHHWMTHNLSSSRPGGGSGPLPAWSKNMDAYFKNIRCASNMKRQRRNDEQRKRVQEDQVADILEATRELRSLGMP